MDCYIFTVDNNLPLGPCFTNDGFYGVLALTSEYRYVINGKWNEDYSKWSDKLEEYYHGYHAHTLKQTAYHIGTTLYSVKLGDKIVEGNRYTISNNILFLAKINFNIDDVLPQLDKYYKLPPFHRNRETRDGGLGYRHYNAIQNKEYLYWYAKYIIKCIKGG